MSRARAVWGRAAAGAVVAATAVLAAAGQAGAQSWTLAAKLRGIGTQSNDRFGISVSLGGGYALIGSDWSNSPGIDSGSAFVFQGSGATWTQVAKLTASDGAAGDNFGRSVSHSGDWFLVGAPWDDDHASDSGSAYMFLRSGATWTQAGKLTASDAAYNDQFGYCVSVSGEYAVVGCPNDDDRGTDSGSAYVFHWTGSAWTQQSKLTVSDGAASDYFGTSVAIDGDYAVVGAILDDDRGSNSGSAYVFHRSGSAWTQVAKLTASDGAVEDQFGCSVAISGEYVLVGAHYDNNGGGSNAGSAYLFHRVGGTWVQDAKLTAADGDDNDQFGWRVALCGDLALVGAYTAFGAGGGYSGAAYVFRPAGASWVQAGKLSTTEQIPENYLGGSVATDGLEALAGAYGSSAAYVFTPEPGTLGLLALGCLGVLGRRRRLPARPFLRLLCGGSRVE